MLFTDRDILIAVIIVVVLVLLLVIIAIVIYVVYKRRNSQPGISILRKWLFLLQSQAAR